MLPYRRSAVALSLVFATCQAFAAEVATVEVSLVIKERCLVRQESRKVESHRPPNVSCDLDSPYLVQPGTGVSDSPTATPAEPSSLTLAPSLWQVTF